MEIRWRGKTGEPTNGTLQQTSGKVFQLLTFGAPCCNPDGWIGPFFFLDSGAQPSLL